LAEFEKAFGTFHEKMATFSLKACNLRDAATALEDGRRRIFDATLVRFQKLHREDDDPYDLELLKEDRLLFTELLCQLHALRLVLLDLRRRQEDLLSGTGGLGPERGTLLVAEAYTLSFEDGQTATLLANVGGTLHGLQAFMKHALAAGGDKGIEQRVTREPLKQYVSQISEICAGWRPMC
jgi:hypothetical protein